MKFSILSLILISLNCSLIAQLYIKPSFSYSHDFFKNYYGNSSSYQINTQNLTLNKSYFINSTFGNGFKTGSSIGYKIKNNVCFELGFNYFKGKNKLFKRNYFRSYNYMFQSTTLKNSEFLILNPAIIHQFILTNKIDNYIKIGFITGKGKINEKFIFSDNLNTGESYRLYSGNYVYGFNLAYGFNYNFTSKISLFSEIEFSSINYSPRFYINYENNNNGHVTYVYNTYSSIELENIDRSLYHINNFNFTLGVKYNLADKEYNKNKYGIELSSGILINKYVVDNPVLPKKLRHQYLIYLPVNLSFLVNFNRLNIGIGCKELFNTNVIKINFTKPNFKTFHVAYLNAEYNVINYNKYALAPNIKFGIYDYFSDYWFNNNKVFETESKLYYEFGLNNQIRFNNYDILINPSISFMGLYPKIPSTYLYTFFIYGINLGIRHWF